MANIRHRTRTRPGAFTQFVHEHLSGGHCLLPASGDPTCDDTELWQTCCCGLIEGGEFRADRAAVHWSQHRADIVGSWPHAGLPTFGEIVLEGKALPPLGPPVDWSMYANDSTDAHGPAERRDMSLRLLHDAVSHARRRPG